jgi:hypothetical protein
MKLYECCDHCEERHPKCHANCEKKKKADKLNEKRKKQKQKESNVTAYTVETQRKMKRRRGEK